jgi:hypothetical protein
VVGVTGKYESVEGVRRERGKASVATEEDILLEVGGVGVIGGVCNS